MKKLHYSKIRSEYCLSFCLHRGKNFMFVRGLSMQTDDAHKSFHNKPWAIQPLLIVSRQQYIGHQCHGTWGLASLLSGGGGERRMSEWVRQSRICHYVLLASPPPLHCRFLSPPVTTKWAAKLSLSYISHMCGKWRSLRWGACERWCVKNNACRQTSAPVSGDTFAEVKIWNTWRRWSGSEKERLNMQFAIEHLFSFALQIVIICNSCEVRCAGHLFIILR